MGKSRHKREESKVRELARKYAKEGFQVSVDPNLSELPESLRQFNHLPDLIVRRGDENLAIEVKTSATVSSVREFDLFVDAVLEKPNWDSVFVLTNPKSSSDVNVRDVTPSFETATDLLRQAKQLAVPDLRDHYSDALLLTTSAAIEATLRNVLFEFRRSRKSKPVDVESLPRDAIIYGLISEEAAKTFEAIIRRSQIVVFEPYLSQSIPEITMQLFADLGTLLSQGSLSK